MKTFTCLRAMHVPASELHGQGTTYRVAYGLERWEDDLQYVFKVQMVYNGKIAGRMSPSYPVGTDDWERVMKMMELVRDGAGVPE